MVVDGEFVCRPGNQNLTFSLLVCLLNSKETRHFSAFHYSPTRLLGAMLSRG